jgi:hypothetical protein
MTMTGLVGYGLKRDKEEQPWHYLSDWTTRGQRITIPAK